MDFKSISKQKITAAVTAVLAVVCAVFGIVSRNAAVFSFTDNILSYCDTEAAAVVTAGLMLPVCVLFVCLSDLGVRTRLSVILYIKIILELIMMSFGINLNVPSVFFFDNLEFIFFIFVDAIILFMAQSSSVNKSVEKAVSQISLAAIVTVLVFTCVLEKNIDTVLRSVYVLCFYVITYCLAMSLPEDSFGEETDGRISVEFTNGLVLASISTAAMSSFITLILFAVCSLEGFTDVHLEFVKFVCCAAWGSFCFLSGVIVACLTEENYTKIKGAVISFVSSAAATVAAVAVTSFARLLRLGFLYGSYEGLSLRQVIIYNVTDKENNSLLHLGIIFVGTFILTFVLSNVTGKINSEKWLDELEEYDDLDENSDFHCKASDAFSFVKSEGNIVSFDFKNKTPVDKKGKPIFEGSSFTMDGKEYDILVTFDDEEENTKYIVYTDNSKEKNGKIRVYASKYNPLTDVGRLLPIESDEEWEAVERILDYAVDDVTGKKNRAKKREGEIDPFVTLNYLAKAIAMDRNNETPFILTAKGEGDGEDDEVISVTMTGDPEERETLLKLTMMSMLKSLMAEQMSPKEAYNELNRLALETVWAVYKEETEDADMPFDEDGDDPEY